MIRIKPWALALSLANLCYLDYWFDPWRTAFFRQQSDHADNLAVIADVVLLGLAFWGVYTLARLSQRRLAIQISKWAFVLVLLIPGNAIKHRFDFLKLENVLAYMTKTELAIGGAIAVTASAGIVVRWRRRIIPALALLVMLLFPFTFFTFGRVLTQWYDERPAALAKSSALSPPPRPSAPSRCRVLWLIFDELDERLTFVERPTGLRLPEIDRLREESLWASNAFPPATSTLLSMPSLINGRIVTSTRPKGPSDLLLTYEGSQQTVSWRHTATLFSQARDLGYKTAILGWYIPYNKILGGSTDFCEFFPFRYPDPDLRFFPRMVKWMAIAPSSIPLVDRVDWLRPLGLSVLRLDGLDHIKAYQACCRAAVPVVANRGFNLILIHWPVPHMPGIYSRSQGDLDYSGRGTYIDNLALADRTLLEMRQAMETAGVWDSTTVLLSADHFYRNATLLDGKSDHRVPFLLKLAGQTSRSDYNRPFNTVVTHDLVLAILRGELQEPESVAGWLDQRSKPEPLAAVDSTSP